MIEFQSENTEGIREFLVGTAYAITAEHEVPNRQLNPQSVVRGIDFAH
jgi:hypothetical protein